MNVAVIPARGGSKRIPRKNVREFLGVPMITWPIQTALTSGLFDAVVVSTDDEEIAAIAVASGAEVPFQRPADLANDHAGTIETVAHAAEWMLQAEWALETVCCIYPCTPLLQSSDLLRAREYLASDDWSYVFPCYEDNSLQRAFSTPEDGGIAPLFSNYGEFRTQDLPPAFRDAGQFYMGRATAWLNHVPIHAATSTVVVIPSERACDIDTESDWAHAEWLVERARHAVL